MRLCTEVLFIARAAAADEIKVEMTSSSPVQPLILFDFLLQTFKLAGDGFALCFNELRVNARMR